MNGEKENRKKQTAAEHFWSEKRPAAGPIPSADADFIVQVVKAMPDGVMVEVYFNG